MSSRNAARRSVDPHRPQRNGGPRIRTRVVAGLGIAALAGVGGVAATGSLDVAHTIPQVEAAAATMTTALLPSAQTSAAPAAPIQPTTAPSGAGVPAATYVTVPAAAVPGLTTAGAASGVRPAAGARAGAGVRTTPESRARLGAEQRASRDADRAVLGATAGFARPVHGTHQSSGFGPRWGRMHKGIDFAGPVGLPIRAVAAGTVSIAEVQSGYGNLIEITHEDGSFTRYGHLDRIRVHPGDEVTPAQIIGTLGNTGRSTGPHLHFEVRTPAGTPINPAPWLRERGIVPAEVEPAAPQE